MDTLMSTEFLTRHVNSVYAAVVPAVVLLGAATIYGSRTLSTPAVEVGTEMKAEFAFKNGVLLPHQEYLYGYSDTGQHFIVGKRLADHDYSAWEAQYSKYGTVEAVTLAESGSKATWSWTVPTPKTFPTLTFLQLLLCFLLGAVCALLIGHAVGKLFSRLSRKKHNKQEESLAMPTNDINAEHAKLNYLWRRTLISMYRDRKTEIMSLIKLAVHYYESSCNLKMALAKEKKRKGEAKSALEKTKAEYANQFAQQQNEIETLRRLLDTQTSLAQNLELSNKAIALENTTANETIKSLEEQVKALQTEKHVEPVETADLGSEYMESATEQDDSSPASENQSASLELGDNLGSSEMEHSLAEAADPEAEGTEGTTEQDDNSPAPDNQSSGVELATNGRPRIQRANRRRDGTIRTASHPDYVPRPVIPGGGGRGGGRNRGRGGGGGGGRGRGRGGNGGAGHGWRGGRGGGGYGGGYGQFNNGRGN